MPNRAGQAIKIKSRKLEIGGQYFPENKKNRFYSFSKTKDSICNNSSNVSTFLVKIQLLLLKFYGHPPFLLLFLEYRNINLYCWNLDIVTFQIYLPNSPYFFFFSVFVMLYLGHDFFICLCLHSTSWKRMTGTI